MDLHKLALFAVLTVGAAALIYNAVSIVNGDGGIAGMTSMIGAPLVARHLF